MLAFAKKKKKRFMIICMFLKVFQMVDRMHWQTKLSETLWLVLTLICQQLLSREKKNNLKNMSLSNTIF